MAFFHSTPVPAFIFLTDWVQGHGDDLAALVAAHRRLAGTFVKAGQDVAAVVAPLAPVFLLGVEFAWIVAGDGEGLS